MKKPHCTECSYFTDVVYEGDNWYGARCKKDGHEEEPSMYAIGELNKKCPLTEEGEEEK